VRSYGLLDVIGHDDIAPTRKKDPGPAFPMASIRSAAMGRMESQDWQGLTTTEVNIRKGPAVDYPKLDKSPLKRGTRLTIVGQEGKWLYVETLKPGGEPDLTGWVYGDYVAQA
jgi:N-acetylmuramoyl-L-alanine amidase